MSEPVRGIAVYPDKRVELVELQADSLEQLQAIVDGWIEWVGFGELGGMYVNEEFRYKFGPEDFNSIAGDVAGLCGRADLMLAGVLGPVVFLGPADRNGMETSVTDRLEAAVRRVEREATR